MKRKEWIFIIIQKIHVDELFEANLVLLGGQKCSRQRFHVIRSGRE
jgi:hypothetical protein